MQKFKLKSGNRPSFKEMGSSPFKIDTSLADPNIDFTASTDPSASKEEKEILKGDVTVKLRYDRYNQAILPQVTSVDDVDENKVTQAVQKIQGPVPTGEDYKSRKERKADKRLLKEEARLDDGKIDKEERAKIKATKLYNKEKEARSKGTMGYDFSFKEGLTYGSKADKLGKRRAKLEKKGEEKDRVAWQNMRTKKMKEDRKAKKKANKKSPTKWVQAVAALAPVVMDMMKKKKEE